MQDVLIEKYVKREIRTLDDEDRNAFLDAMSVLYRTSKLEGMELYGDNYITAYDVSQLHNNLAGDVDGGCDHLHDGYGFLPAHMAITSAFEYALFSKSIPP
jgi:hypothetical protein